MGTGDDPSRRDLLAHVVVPVATAGDARKTARALEPYEPDRVTALHVVEKGTSMPIEYSEEMAEEAYEAVRSVFPDADTHTAYAREIVPAIFDAADEIDATAVAYRSRGGNRLLQFLSGDRSLRLVTEADRPVIALPKDDTESS